MTTAQAFVVYGMGVLIAGFLLGSILGIVRMKAPDARSLATAHVETLMQGSMHLGLAFAVGIVGFSSGWATIGAWLLVVGSAMQALGATTNWLTRTGDQFAENSPGYKLNTASTLFAMPGLLITAIGIFANV